MCLDVYELNTAYASIKWNVKISMCGSLQNILAKEKSFGLKYLKNIPLSQKKLQFEVHSITKLTTQFAIPKWVMDESCSISWTDHHSAIHLLVMMNQKQTTTHANRKCHTLEIFPPRRVFNMKINWNAEYWHF